MTAATAENPRWSACRVALGREPKAWEFACWCRGQVLAWERETQPGRGWRARPEKQAEFTAWLVRRGRA